MGVYDYTNKSAIQSIRDTYDSTIKTIEGDGRLSQHGARIEKGRAYVAAVGKMNALRDQYRHTVKTRQQQLESTLYGPGASDPASIVAHRDALDRVGKIGSDKDAKAAWETAQWSGDTGMQKAIAAKANRMGWNDTLTAHEDEYPQTSDLFQELRALPDYGTKADAGPVGETAVFRVAKPSGFGVGDVNYIANEVQRSDAADAAAGGQ